MSQSAEIGVSGLATMGRNLARNLARHGHAVALHNRTAKRTHDLVDQFSDEGTFVPAESAEEFVRSLERPRRIVLMVPAGKATDAVIDEFTPLLESGDVIIDAGNAHFADTRRREKALRDQGLNFVGMGVSGGEEGALNGPSIMPGGPDEAYESLGPLLEDISAHVDGAPCCTHIGADGAGHFVKMVHNGIEYADMQLIAEAYDLLRSGLGMDPAGIAEVFRTWNQGRLDSYLIEITAQVLAHDDGATGKPFVDVVADEAEQKGTGRWTVQAALDLGVPVTGIAEATFARSLSGNRTLRDAARGLPGVSRARLEGAAAEGFVDDIEQALYASKIVAYAQGFNENPGRRGRVRLVDRPRAGCEDLAGRLYHPGQVPQRDHVGLRAGAGSDDAADGPVVHRVDRRGAGLLAAGGRVVGPAGDPDAGLLLGPVLLRRDPGRSPAGGPRPGPARLLRRPHLPAGGQGRHVPHRVGHRRPGGVGSVGALRAREHFRGL